MTRSYVIFVGVFAICLTAAALAVKRAHRAPAGPDPQSMLARAEDFVARWTTGKVPLSGRTVTLLVYDRSSDGDLLEPPAEGREPSVASWLGRLLGWRRRAPETAAFLQAMRQDPSVLPLPFDGFSTASEAELVEGLAGVLAKAREAGAVVHVVTQGAGVRPALKALARSEGGQPQGASGVVGKLVSIGVDRGRLKRIDPIFFAEPPHPSNVMEWATFYRDPPAAPVFELSSRGGPASTLPADGVFVVSGAELAAAVLGMMKEARTIQALADAARSAAQRELDERRERRFRAVKDGSITTRSAAQPAGPTPPPPDGSLSVIVGGREYSEDATEEAPSKIRPAYESSHAEAPVVDWAALDAACGSCCAASGGRWKRGAHQQEACWNYHCEEKYGCCEGAGFDPKAPPPPCQRCAAFAKCHGGEAGCFSDGNGWSHFRCQASR